LSAQVTEFPVLSNIPAELRDRKRWCLWRSEQREGEAKPRKVPYWVSGNRRYGEQGSALDLASLATFDEACAALRKGGYSGLGFAMLGDGIVALDFDNCIDAAGAIADEVLALVADSYAERSPSGRGVRAFFFGHLQDRKQPGFEVFSAKGFVTVTGHQVDECALIGGDIIPLTPAVTTAYQKAFGDRPNGTGTGANTGAGTMTTHSQTSPSQAYHLKAHETIFFCWTRTWVEIPGCGWAWVSTIREGAILDGSSCGTTGPRSAPSTPTRKPCAGSGTRSNSGP
jgi:primase-polymerase (primpol)-like protein